MCTHPFAVHRATLVVKPYMRLMYCNVLRFTLLITSSKTSVPGLTMRDKKIKKNATAESSKALFTLQCTKEKAGNKKARLEGSELSAADRLRKVYTGFSPGSI